jgi:hypothetical protein
MFEVLNDIFMFFGRLVGLYFDFLEWFCNSHDLESSTSQTSILFGSFASPIIPVSIPPIASNSDGFSIKIGEITCFLGDSCCSDVYFTITDSEGDKQSKNFEPEFVLFVVSQRLQN